MTLFAPPTAFDVHQARTRISPHIVITPMLRNTALDQRTGGQILIKPEVLQRTGSFKLRGATNALLRLDTDQLRRGVVTFSSGNHGQAIACAAKMLRAPATIIMPLDAPAIKRRHTEAWGAKIIGYDRFTENRESLAQFVIEQTGAVLIPPFEHPDVIAGQGTLALELGVDAKARRFTMDAMLVCTGGGGLVAGCALALSDISPETKVYAVEPDGWDDTARSLAAGKRVANDMRGSKLCDAILTATPGELTFSINQRLLAGGLVVSNDDVRAAIRFAFEHLKLVVEPGGAVALAALLGGAFDARDKVVGIVLSGGNTDPDSFALQSDIHLTEHRM